ncbi:hypothetical protein QQF64_019351 [Cirrhinus molitorella]|uniref:Uncharacterized protein n=2 Tax=Cirrhinus molitorella TaxID=172907 RepID=A0ABR3LFC0_9TELE|nr:hypothetical protein Q8A67_005787 [Cirrhinus molitorella]
MYRVFDRELQPWLVAGFPLCPLIGCRKAPFLLDELSDWLLIGLERLSGCGLMLCLMNIHKRRRATCGLTLVRLLDESVIFQRLYHRFPWTLPDLFGFKGRQISAKVTLSGYDLVTRLIDVWKPRPCFKSTCAFRNSL